MRFPASALPSSARSPSLKTGNGACSRKGRFRVLDADCVSRYVFFVAVRCGPDSGLRLQTGLTVPVLFGYCDGLRQAAMDRPTGDPDVR